VTMPGAVLWADDRRCVTVWATTVVAVVGIGFV
jgi:hypothetical protein